MTDRRFYQDPATAELLFLTSNKDGWVADVRTMDTWRTGRLRIYKPIDTAFIYTVTASNTTSRWQPLAPEEEPDVRVLMPKPWIPDGQAMEDLCEEDIPVIEAALATHASPEFLNDVLRPVLVMEFSYMPVALAPAAPAAPARPTGAATAATTFPAHLIGPVLAHAAATKALCPITMEPINAATATVTSCGHIFQTAAIEQWLRSRRQCPECRGPL